jgi:hypothetical protein
MDLAQALMLVLSVPAMGFLLAMLTTVEMRLPGKTGSGKKAGGCG